jgi:hypothetical protein
MIPKGVNFRQKSDSLERCRRWVGQSPYPYSMRTCTPSITRRLRRQQLCMPASRSSNRWWWLDEARCPGTTCWSAHRGKVRRGCVLVLNCRLALFFSPTPPSWSKTENMYFLLCNFQRGTSTWQKHQNGDKNFGAAKDIPSGTISLSRVFFIAVMMRRE